VNARAESPGETPKLAGGWRTRDLARRTRGGNGGHGGFGGDERAGWDHLNAPNARARSEPSLARRFSLSRVQEWWSGHWKVGSTQGTCSAILLKSLVVMGVFFLGGCASSHHRVPSIDVFGSYFPAWLLSLLAGVLLTIIAASAGRLMDIRPSGLRALILSVSLILIFSISIWFWFFAS
jgi:hypothetical protein